jgi:hypothetical protein
VEFRRTVVAELHKIAVLIADLDTESACSGRARLAACSGDGPFS